MSRSAFRKRPPAIHPARTTWLVALLILLTVLAYLPVLRAGFIWDDDTFLWDNPLIKSADGLFKFWFTTQAPDYFPLTSTMLWLEWRVWGTNPMGYHAVNVVLHALGAVVWWRVLIRLKVPLAWLAAAVFALHPVNVESVAWITERKNTLAMLFYALTLLMYLRFNQNSEFGIQNSGVKRGATHVSSSSPWFWYFLALVFFGCSLLSKTSGVMLPVVLLGLAWWQRGRVTRQDVMRGVPFFVVSLVMGLVTVWFQSHRAIGVDVVRNAGFGARLAGAGWAFWFYLYKAVLPLNLAFVYPRWQINPANALSYAPGVLLLGALLVCWMKRGRWGRGLVFGLGYFLLLLLPVLGFINIYFMRYSLVADHWQYFSIMGVIVLALAGLDRLFDRLWRQNAIVRPIFSAALLIGLGVLTWRQCGIYHDMETLWKDTLKKNPDSWLALNNLGGALVEQGHPVEGMAYLQRSLRVNPDNPETLVNLGAALVRANEPAEALTNYETSLRLQPDGVEALIGLGKTLALLGRLNDAAAQLQAAVQSHPGEPQLQAAFAEVLATQGKTQEAIEHYQESLNLAPRNAETHNNLGLALVSQGRWEEAIAEFEAVLREDPGFLEAHKDLGNVLIQTGRPEEAIPHLRLFLEHNPNDAGAQGGLGIALAMTGKLDEAVAHLREAVRLKPDDADTRFNLANALGAQHQFGEAIEEYREVLRLAPGHYQAHNNLGYALADAGRREEAVKELKEALRLKPHFAPAKEKLHELGVPLSE